MVDLDNGQAFNLNAPEEAGASVAQFCYYLEVILPNGAIRQISLSQNESLIIGRSPNRCQLLLNDPRVSRVHLNVEYDPKRGVTVTDIHSAHGSRLDGHFLQSGTRMTWLINQPVVIGSTHLILRYGALENQS